MFCLLTLLVQVFTHTRELGTLPRENVCFHNVTIPKGYYLKFVIGYVVP
ncbi:hypothetical protein DYU05_11535 [Mucilaginibacter terrenus]|uniref:CUB-like domain-containing protein n=1 Tax=Mucilaginibacter terrenus TaxID=2482727 RepID=A0A3E2NPH3_9SPHI|nr:hypothetical protein DYU05_11535 [Mucilaginibacter terrenus]